MDFLESVLVVDDNQDLLEGLAQTLEEEDYQVFTAANGVEALAVLESQRVDLVLADIAMPGMNGYELYERMRENRQWTTIPFVFLTARAMDSDIRYGKGLGVDDYLIKPFQPRDLLAVVQGKLRRARQLARLSISDDRSSEPDRARLTVGALRIEPGRHQVWLHDQAVELSTRQFKLLEYLAQRPGRLASHQELIQATHGLKVDPIEAGTLVRPLVRAVRRKLGHPVGDPGCIENVRGVGYRLIPP